MLALEPVLHFGNFFIKQNFEVRGIDISELLIKDVKNLIQRVISKVGNSRIWNMIAIIEFDAVYSFHCTWYFPNFLNLLMK